MACVYWAVYCVAVKAEAGVTYVGADAVALRDQLILSRPMQRGEVTDWNAIEVSVSAAVREWQ